MVGRKLPPVSALPPYLRFAEPPATEYGRAMLAVSERRGRPANTPDRCKHDKNVRDASARRYDWILNPDAPIENVRVCPTTGRPYSVDPDDYLALCGDCHE